MSDPHAATDKLTHLLLVEPEGTTRESLTQLARGLFYRVHWAPDTHKARQLLASEPIELIVIDIVSGPSQQESGFEFALWIREQSPYAYVDLLFVSRDYPARLYRETSLLRYQALEYLDKPVAEETWHPLLESFQRGELMPPTSVSEVNPDFSGHAVISMAPGHLGDAEEILDPDEWADALFAARHASFEASDITADEAHGSVLSAQDLPSFDEPTNPGRPTTETRALARRLHQEASEASDGPAGQGEPSPHTPAPAPHPAPQYLALHPHQRPNPPLTMPQTTPNHPLPASVLDQPNHRSTSNALQALTHTPAPQSKDVADLDPERERPTQSLPGLPAPTEGYDAPVVQSTSQGHVQRQSHNAFEIGMQALQKQQLEKALHAFYQAADLDPTPRHRAYFGWTLALSMAHDPGQVQRAEAMLRQAVLDAPALEQVHYLLGRFYQHQRRFHEAIEVYRTALSVNPQFQEIYREFRLLQLQMTR